MFNPDGLPVWAKRHRLPADVAAHDHDFFEIALVTQGSGLHIAADGDHPIGPGSVVVVPPNQWHGYAQCDDIVLFDSFVAPELVYGTLSFLDAELPLMQSVHKSSLSLPQRIQLGQYDVSLAIAELHSMSDTTPARRSRIELVGHLLIYLDILNRSWTPEQAIHRRSTASLHPAVSRAAQLMEDDPGRPWTLSQLATATATERTHLVRLFQRELGAPPIAYLNRLREQAAARLLVQTDDPVAQIGARVGWEDAGYFARRFKNAYGLSPSAYRNRARTGEARYHASPEADAALPISGARFGVVG
ncbi:helix-turn-helix domain-containing protein [Kribbella sp. NPDC004536]|uniref:AraC family transcriptional regulator n=1 Tax=Kribbella sp. NPDC004536 TaxID=3364106 RepID=UPI00368E9C16